MGWLLRVYSTDSSLIPLRSYQNPSSDIIRDDDKTGKKISQFLSRAYFQRIRRVVV